MQDFSKRRSRTQFLLHFFLRGGGVLLLLFIAFVAIRGTYAMYGKFSQAALAREQAEGRLEKLEDHTAQVGAAVEAFDSSRGIEAEVRERYGVARPGEGRIEIVRDEASTSPQQASSQNIFMRLLDALWPF